MSKLTQLFSDGAGGTYRNRWLVITRVALHLLSIIINSKHELLYLLVVSDRYIGVESINYMKTFWGYTFSFYICNEVMEWQLSGRSETPNGVFEAVGAAKETLPCSPSPGM